MIYAGTARFLRHSCFTCITVVAAFSSLPSVDAQSQAPKLPDTPGHLQPLQPTDPNVLPKAAAQDTNLLSMQGGQRLMSDASSAVSSQNYTLAAKKLQEAREVFNQLSNFYQELANSFSGIDNRIADGQRQKALQAAQLRDDATYQLALVHRAENQPELAVPLLVQIIRSQNPTRDLGKKAYQQLFELGFVDSPYPKAGSQLTPPTSPASPTSSTK